MKIDLINHLHLVDLSFIGTNKRNGPVFYINLAVSLAMSLTGGESKIKNVYS